MKNGRRISRGSFNAERLRRLPSRKSEKYRLHNILALPKHGFDTALGSLAHAIQGLKSRRQESYDPYTFQFFRYLWKFKLTPSGRFLFAGVCFSSFGLLTVLIPVYQFFFSLVALFVVAWLVGLIFRPKLAIEGEFPTKATAGQPISARLHVKNVGRMPALDVMFGFSNLPSAIKPLNADEVAPRLNSGESVTVSVAIEPLRRGLYELSDLRAFSTFPFNLLRNGSARTSTGSLLVLPSFQQVASIDVPLGTKYQPGGVALTSNVGESPEYIGNREYVPGEPARRLDFRSWARLAKPVVREFQEEYYCRVALILDTFIPSKRKTPQRGFPNLEAAISLSASVADVLSQGEYLIDIFAAGPELYVFRAGRHTAHFENILEILACVDACRKDPFEVVAPAVSEELGNISTAICVFLDWDHSRRKLARAVVEAGCRLKVIIVRDSETSEMFDGDEFPDYDQYSTSHIRDGNIEVL